MSQILEHVGELADTQLVSTILLILVLGDTLMSCLWRSKKGESIFSKSLWTGFAFNLIGSAVPFITHFLLFNKHYYFFDFAVIAWGLVFGVATAFSIMANYKLYSPEAYKTIVANAPKLLSAEIESKVSKTKK